MLCVLLYSGAQCLAVLVKTHMATQPLAYVAPTHLVLRRASTRMEAATLGRIALRGFARCCCSWATVCLRRGICKAEQASTILDMLHVS
jgi:hypothetical protein